MRVLLVALLLLPFAAADHGHEILIADPVAPTHSEVEAVVQSVMDHPWANVSIMGYSLDALPIYAVAFTDPESPMPMDERVVTYIMTQQHGNEPAGTPAAMQLIEHLRDDGELRQYLTEQIVVVMPQSNPDGALDNRRTNELSEDINRDHVDVGSPEAKAIHKVLTTWDVHLAFDHHEYGGAPTGGIGYPSPVHSYDYDITTMFPNHGNVRGPTSELALELNYDHVVPALEDAGYSHGDYGTTTIHAGPVHQDVAQTAGGPDPGILRNNFGLNNVAGLLIESFVPPASDDNPFQSFDRRVASHFVVMETVVKFAAEHREHVIDAKRESERLNLEEPLTKYTEGATSPMKAFFAVDKLHEATFTAHGLPMGGYAAGDYHHAVAQERGGLIAALFHPESSRAVEAGEMVNDVALRDDYYQHADFGAEAIETLDVPFDQSVPNVGFVLLLVGLLVLARRR